MKRTDSSSYHSNPPVVGLGVIIENADGKILIGKRLGKHAPFYSIPGGKLEPGETFEQGAIREISEETGLKIIDPKVIAITNNLETFRREKTVHSISIILYVKNFCGQPKVMEPEKCGGFTWCNPHDLPQPHFDASRLGIECWLLQKVYVGISS